VLLVAAICGLHFIGMAAIELIPNPLVAMPDNVVAPELLAVLVAAATIGIVMLGMLASIVEEQLGRRAKREADELRRSQEHLGRVLRISGIGTLKGISEPGASNGRLRLAESSALIPRRFKIPESIFTA
jgi:hypothetical protein